MKIGFAFIAVVTLMFTAKLAQAGGPDPIPSYDPETANIYNAAAPSLLAYAFFHWSGKGDATDCFGTLDTDVPKAIKEKFAGGQYSFQWAHTAYNNPNGTFSVMHPSLIARNTATGETLALITDDDSGFNVLGVHSLGINPSDAQIARALSDLNHTPVVQFGSNVWANKMFTSVRAGIESDHSGAGIQSICPV